MSRLSSRSLLFTTSPPDRSADTEYVDHEDQGVVALDQLAGALLAVAELGRDLQHHPAAGLDPDQALVPALDRCPRRWCGSTWPLAPAMPGNSALKVLSKGFFASQTWPR